MTRYLSFFLTITFTALFNGAPAHAESEALLKDKTAYLDKLTLGKCRFEVVPLKSNKGVKVKVWLDGKPSGIFHSGEGSGTSYTQAEAEFPYRWAEWRNGHWRTGLSKLTHYSTYSNGTRSSGFNQKWIESWFGPKGDIVHVRLTSKRYPPTLLGLVTASTFTVDCKN